MRGGSNPDGRIAAPGLLRFANKNQSAILLILLTLEESKAIGRNPICHTRESGYPVGHDAAAQDGPTSPVKSG